MNASERFELIVIGAGPAGETVASRLADRGLRTALVEQELVGGECAYYACIPSKTLLRPGEVGSEATRAAGVATPDQQFAEISRYRDSMIRNLNDTGQVEEYERQGVTVVRGEASLSGPGQVDVDGQRLEGERIVIATGTEPAIPPIDGLEQAGYWTNREATTLKAVPDSAVILGGGPVGIELAQMLRRFGASVTLIEAGERLLEREDPRVSELVAESLSADGVELHLGAKADAVSVDGGMRSVRFGQREASARELIVAVGRKPRVSSLGLERIGIEPGPRGIEVDERCRAADDVWAIGDVTGVAQFTHVAMYQGRVACADIVGESVRADYSAIPRVVFCDPEVASVGMTRAQAKQSGIEVSTAHVKLAEAIARPWTYETEPRGELMVIADRHRSTLVGAWAVGPLASEWIHYAALAIKAQLPVAVLKDTVAQFPTYSEAYLKALERLKD